jgi:hypothetical protein
MQTSKSTFLVLAVAVIALGTARQAGGQERLLAPVISSVAPQAPSRSATVQVLTISGVNFSEGLSLTIVEPDGRKQSYAGPAIQARRDTSFKASVTLAALGAYTLIVTNPDGAASDPFVLKGSASPQPATPGPSPKIDRVLPGEPTKDPLPQTLAVTGEHFAQGLSVYLTDPIGTVFLIKGSALGSFTATSFTVLAALDMTGDYTLLVTNPSGESSNSMTIKVVMRADARRP